ncbi:MAG: hypothetical protein O2840_04890 [bacterium]|nr:hypothetical protein [bacterium]
MTEISNLENVYQRALHSRSDSVFFQSIFDYIEAFDQEPYLVEINKQIIALADQDLKKEIDLEKKVQKEVLKTHKEVETYLKTHETGSRTVVEHMQKVTDAWKGDLISSAGKTRQMYDDITYALVILARVDDKKHLQFCRKYGKIHDNASVANWAKVSTTYPEWESERDRNKRLLRFKVWHAWNEIAEFHNWFSDYETERDKLIDSNMFWELSYVSSKFKAIQAAITGDTHAKTPGIDIRRDEYQRYLDMIHQHIKQQLSHQASESESNRPSCQYNSKTGKFSIDDTTIRFAPNNARGLILKMFLQNKNSRKKTMYWEDIFDKLGENTGAYDSEKKRHKVYYAVIAIATRISKEYLVEDFMSYIDGYVFLNPKFHL